MSQFNGEYHTGKLIVIYKAHERWRQGSATDISQPNLRHITNLELLYIIESFSECIVYDIQKTAEDEESIIVCPNCIMTKRYALHLPAV
eukprot:scaffold6899_cov183-Amphora_coffeaeformis.AAC.20